MRIVDCMGKGMSRFIYKRINGSREAGPNSDIYVYKANTDYSRGKFLRIEKEKINRRRCNEY